jgi:LysR family carnitine catabolism transcriptional activator
MKRINLSLFEIEVFLQVDRLRSFRAAAEALGMSQPAVSRAVARAETRLGVRLFDRNTRTVEPTPQGREFAAVAGRLIGDLTASLGDLGEYFRSSRGRVAVAGLPSVMTSLLPPLIDRFQRTHPGIAVTVIDTLLDGVVGAVLRGEADLGIAGRPAAGAGPLDFTGILSDRFVAILRQDHPLAGAAAVSWADLARFPFIAMSRITSVRPLTDRGFAQAGVTVEPVFEVSHLATAGALAAAGLGVTALPELTLPVITHRALVTRPLADPVLTRDIGLLTRSGRTLSPATAAFRDTVLAGNGDRPASPR